MRIFDADRQEWASHEQEQRIAELHDRDAVRQDKALRGAVSVLAVCALAFGGWALGWKDEPEPTGYLTAVEQPEASPEDTPSPSAPGGPPDGYETVQDAFGYRLALPDEGWTRSTADAVYGPDIVNYRNFDGSRRLQVYKVQEPSGYESLQVWLDQPKRRLPDGFDRLDLTRADVGGLPSARLDYLADSLKDEPDIGPWYVIDQRFESVDGELYALAVYGADADGRSDEEALMETALAWFCPPEEICPEPAD
ncbi:hypothetical protein ACFWY6_16255 [Streptomyces sp. NPDC059037]|uniref:hypothetical protein n=1 Tax=Streptomyces sp. NPDC059037 TaxID=3346710 RepID=UPI003690B45A